METKYIFRAQGIVILVILCVGCSLPVSTVDPIPSLEISPTPGVIIAPTQDRYLQKRLDMVEETIENRGVEDSDVLRAMRNVPRHLFVPSMQTDLAYEDHPLPIGYGQTISQPYIVAWMTELLDLKEGDKVLEIGTGSGYQAAVLAELGYGEVYSIEIIPELAESAAARLKELGYDGVYTKQGDGYFGWKECAPYDAIIVTAAPDHLPPPLVEQLTEDGRIVIPIGPIGFFQTLWKFENENGELVAHNLGGVAFVPLTGEGVETGSGTPKP
jgi:protein-L-isoaspartate(D-aspartate) O-methyltransferase